MPTSPGKGLCDELRDAAVTLLPELNPEQRGLTPRTWTFLGKSLPLVGTKPTACHEGVYIYWP